MKDFQANKSRFTRFGQHNHGTSRSKSSVHPCNNAQGMNNMAEASKRGLLDTMIGRMAANVLAADPNDPRAHRIIEELLAEDDARAAQTAPFLKRQINEGNIVLGEDVFDRIAHRQWLHHFTNTLVVSVPGGGKSTLIHGLAPQLAFHGCSVLLIDSEKEELQRLFGVFGEYGKTLQVLKGREFPFNPLEIPPQVPPFEFLEHIALTVGGTLEVAEPGIRLLKEVLYKQYHEHGVFNGQGHFPVLFEVRDEIAKNRTANPLVREALLARLDAILINTPGLRFRTGVSVERISSTNLILECAGMAPPARDLLVGSIITKEFLRRKQLQYINAPLDWAVFFDDGQRICANPEGHLARLINIVRSTGITLSFFVQSAHQVAPAILSNCSTKLCGILGSSEDIYCMSQCMGLLNNDQKQWLATKLKRGQFLCQLGHGWRDPFLLEVRPGMVHDYLSPTTIIPPERQLGNESLEQDREDASFWETGLVEAKEFRDWIPPEWKVSPIAGTGMTSPEALTAREEEFLRVVVQSPGQPCSSYNKKLSFSQKVALEVRKQLIEKGLMYEENVRTQTLGRTAKLLIPTEAGKERFLDIGTKTGEMS